MGSSGAAVDLSSREGTGDEESTVFGTTTSAPDVRIDELIVLSSMYPGQSTYDDPHVLQAVSDQDCNLGHRHKQIGLTFRCDKYLDIHIILDVEYPTGAPVRAHCRLFDGQLPNSVQKQLNDSVGQFIATCAATDTLCDVITVVQKVLDLWTDLKGSGSEQQAIDGQLGSNDTNASTLADTTPGQSPAQMSRYWIYSHHIKSTKKRQMIISLAQELHLNGITCVGKPGFICVEGLAANCEEFWQQIRATNWQRITLIETEPMSGDNYSQVFDDYHELADTSQLFRYLEGRHCDRIVKAFLGFQSSTVNTNTATTGTNATTSTATAPVAKD